MSNISIKIENLGKQYRLGVTEEKQETLAGTFVSWVKSPLTNYRRLRSLSHFGKKEMGDDVLWALNGVSFEVNQGEVVGVIGRNGAGKSTLLKILSRITPPTMGKIELNGRVASLLEVGTGFHPELTGRENIYLNGTILGMTKTEIDRKFDEIVDFSGVEKFIDTPVKRYSSGMSVRLAFSVAAYLEPEILLIDEVLAVGDAGFQKKSLGKMDEVSKSGRTIIFVSHNMTQINKLCDRVILLKDGHIINDGSASLVINNYMETVLDREPIASNNGPLLMSSTGSVKLLSIEVFGDDDADKPIVAGKSFHVRMNFQFEEEIREPAFIVSLRTLDGIELLRLSTQPISGISTGVCLGKTQCALFIDELLLTGGEYVLAVGVSLPKINFLIPITEISRFTVMANDYYKSGFSSEYRFGGYMLTSHQWDIKSSET